MSNEITKEEMRAILEQKIVAYKQAYYSHQVDAKVAQDIGEQQMLKAATDNMAKMQKIIDAVEKMIAEIEDS